MARDHGIDANELSPKEIAKMYPLATTTDLIGGVNIPRDAQVGPHDVTMTLVKGAKMGGAKFYEDT